MFFRGIIKQNSLLSALRKTLFSCIIFCLRLLNKFTPNFSLAQPLYVLFCSNLYQEAVTLILFAIRYSTTEDVYNKHFPWRIFVHLGDAV